MARPLSWIARLPEIRRSVAGSIRSHYERRDIELLFQMQPRAAGKLVAMLPKDERLGQSHLVKREALQRFLDEIHSSADVNAAYAALRRKERRVSRRKPRVLFRKDLLEDGELIALPANVELTVGGLQVRFNTLLELVEALAMIAGCLRGDEEAFEARYVPAAAKTAAQEKAAAERKDMETLFAELRKMEEKWALSDTKTDTTKSSLTEGSSLLAESEWARIPHSPPD